MNGAVMRFFYEVLHPARNGSGGRAQQYADVLDRDGRIADTIKLGTPAPIAAVHEAVERNNGGRSR